MECNIQNGKSRAKKKNAKLQNQTQLSRTTKKTVIYNNIKEQKQKKIAALTLGYYMHQCHSQHRFFFFNRLYRIYYK